MDEGASKLRVLPNDVLAEQAVLGSMLTDKDAAIIAIGKLKPEDFYREDNKEIFSAMYDIYNSGKQIDSVTLQNELKLRGTFEKVGGLTYIASLVEIVPTTSNIENYCEIVEQKSTMRNLIKTANDIIKMGYSGTEEADVVIEGAEKKIFEVVQNRNNTGFSSAKEILVTSFENLEELYKNKGKVAGIESGFIDLDRKTAGLNPSALIIVAARPAMGKSAFVLNIAAHVAKNNIPVMIFSLEMSKTEMMNRILCAESMVDSMKVKNADLNQDDWLKLGEASSKLANIPLYIDDSGGLSGAELRAKCRKAKLEKRIGLVIVDYLQLMEGKSRDGNRQQEISEISRTLKLIAKELNVPVIALSQLSRATASRADHRPELTDLRESGSIEQDADIVMFLHREDYYDPNTERKNIAEVIIAKNRSGETGTVELTWLGRYTKFDNFSPLSP